MSIRAKKKKKNFCIRPGYQYLLTVFPDKSNVLPNFENQNLAKQMAFHSMAAR